MKFLKISLLLSGLTLFVFACTQATNTTNNTTTANNRNAVVTATPATAQTSPTAADELAEARNIFKQNCVGCHKEDGTGGEKTLDDGKKIKVPNYKSKGAMEAKDEDLLDYIMNGEEGEMPAFKDKLTEAQMKSLVKFIRKEFQGK